MRAKTLASAMFGGMLLSPWSSSAADLKITREFTSSGRSSTETLYISGQRTRREWRSERGTSKGPGKPVTFAPGPRRATIYQCDLRRELSLDLDAREYTKVALDERGVIAGLGPVALPPKPAAGGTLIITLDTVDTGERKEMFGHTARHIITRETRVASTGACSPSSEGERDGWYIDLDIRESCLKWKARYATAVLVSSSNHCRDEIKIQETGIKETGFPLELRRTTRTLLSLPGRQPETITDSDLIRVTELVEGPLDPALFEHPKGFKRVWRLPGERDIPLGWRLPLQWESLKNEVATLFR